MGVISQPRARSGTARRRWWSRVAWTIPDTSAPPCSSRLSRRRFSRIEGAFLHLAASSHLLLCSVIPRSWIASGSVASGSRLSSPTSERFLWTASTHFQTVLNMFDGWLTCESCLYDSGRRHCCFVHACVRLLHQATET